MANTVYADQADLYISDIVITDKDTGNTTHHYYNNIDILASGSHSSGSSNGISYSYSSSTGMWTISGTATADSIHTILNIPGSISNYMDKSHQYILKLNKFSSGDAIPIRIFYFNGGSIISYEDYPSGENITSVANYQPVLITMPEECTGIQIVYYVPAGTTVSGCLVYQLFDDTDERETIFTYGDTFKLVVSGGSGSGSLHYAVESITGDASISSSGQLTFKAPGTVWVKITKDGSSFSRYPDGTSVTGRYLTSKTLVIAITLESRQVRITVSPDLIQNIGVGSPVYEPEDYGISYTLAGGTLAVRPDIYFVYDSYDFYKFDVFSKVFSEDRYDNGVRYIKQPDGSWILRGVATADSYYNLIMSPLSLPHFLKPDRKYQLIREYTSVPLQIKWYRANGTVESTNYTSNAIFRSPEDTIGVVMRFYVAQGRSVNGYQVQYRMYDLQDRYMDSSEVSKYPISARHAVVSSVSGSGLGYDPKIHYRSAWVRYQNIRSFRVYVRHDASLGDAYTTATVAKPYTYLILTVKAKVDSYFDDGWSNSYVPSPSSSLVYDQWWAQAEYKGYNIDKVTQGNQGTPSLYMIDGDGNRVPFFRMSYTTDSSSYSRLVEGTYLIIMPVSNLRIVCTFDSISSSANVPYGRYPYTDIGYGSNYPVQLKDKEYQNALQFCYYAREFYLHDASTPLMRGVSADKFYNTYEGDDYAGTDLQGKRIHYISRRDMVEVLRRVSHIRDFPNESSWTIDRIAASPDTYQSEKAKAINTPNAHLFGYAGYPPGLSYTDSEGNVQTLPSPIEYTPKVEYFSDSARPYVYTGYVANDDYLTNAKYLHSISWNAWVGTVNGYDNKSFAPDSFATFQEAITVLWRYAKYRQFSTMTEGNPNDINDWQYDVWAQNGPLRWAIRKGISTGYHAPMVDTAAGINYGSNVPIQAKDYVDRVEWAYMVAKLCQLYAW